MEQLIHSRLIEIEAENTIRIVYACESGSRAWRFPSANSDYDVRFIYTSGQSTGIFRSMKNGM